MGQAHRRDIVIKLLKVMYCMCIKYDEIMRYVVATNYAMNLLSLRVISQEYLYYKTTVTSFVQDKFCLVTL